MTRVKAWVQVLDQVAGEEEELEEESENDEEGEIEFAAGSESESSDDEEEAVPFAPAQELSQLHGSVRSLLLGFQGLLHSPLNAGHAAFHHQTKTFSRVYRCTFWERGI